MFVMLKIQKMCTLKICHNYLTIKNLEIKCIETFQVQKKII